MLCMSSLMLALQKESFSFELKGCSSDHIMYVRGGEPLTADVQSLCVVPQPESDESQSTHCIRASLQTVTDSH